MITNFPRVETTKEPPRGSTSYISASRLNLWLRCPLAWKLKYVDGITTPTTPSLLVGKVVHAGLEVWYRHRQLGIPTTFDTVRQRVSEIWQSTVATEHVRFEKAAEESRLQTQSVDLVMTYLRDVPPDEPRPLGVEASLEMPLVDPVTGEDLGVRLLGIIDLVLDQSAGPVIVDFKTAGSSAAPSPLAHEIQLTVYSYLLRSATGHCESELQIRSLIKTKVPKIVNHQYLAREARHFRRLFAVIREYLAAIDRQQFNYRPSWMCGMCDYAGTHCAHWSG